jgi:hypothetical protein
VKKKPIKPIKILKKSASSIRFQFYKPKTEKRTEPNQKKKNQKKTRAKAQPN